MLYELKMMNEEINKPTLLKKTCAVIEGYD